MWPNDEPVTGVVDTPIDGEAAWKCIAAARGIVAELTGCSPDEALRAMKERADDLGDSIGTLAAGLIGGASWRVREPSSRSTWVFPRL